MYQLVESIQISDGSALSLHYHQQRFDYSRKLKFKSANTIPLDKEISIPDYAKHGIWKCRVFYRKCIEEITYEPYQLKIISSLKILVDNKIEYCFKYKDREDLMNLYSQRENYDDILIVKNCCLTDSFAANCVFINDTEKATPFSPLLKGTMRAQLLDRGIIKEKIITINNLRQFNEVKLINAFRTLDVPGIKIEDIIL